MIAIGKSFMAKSARGEKLTPIQAIQAKCYDCVAGYVDGKVDCEADGIRGTHCPLYQWMPYRGL